MAMYRVRLESPDLMRDNGKPEFRITTLAADSAEAAREWCERKEQQLVAHRYSDKPRVDPETGEKLPSPLEVLETLEAEAHAKGELPPGHVRGRLGAHRQETPYEVVSVEEVK